MGLAFGRVDELRPAWPHDTEEHSWGGGGAPEIHPRTTVHASLNHRAPTLHYTMP